MSGDEEFFENQGHAAPRRPIRRHEKVLRGLALTGVAGLTAGVGGCEVDKGADHIAEMRRAEETRHGVLKAIKSDLEARDALLKKYDSVPFNEERPVPKKPEEREVLPPRLVEEKATPNKPLSPEEKAALDGESGDLAEQLTDLIIKRRAYEANSNLITTAPALIKTLQEGPVYPSALVKRACDYLSQHLDARGADPTHTLQSARFMLGLAEHALDLRKRPEGVTEEEDEALRKAIGEHLTELKKYLGPPQPRVR